MPVLYSLFPGPINESGEVEELSEGSHYSDEFLPALFGRHPHDHGHKADMRTIEEDENDGSEPTE